MQQNPITDEQLNQIEARANAATKGPWFVHDDWPGRVFAESEFNVHIARFTGSNPEPNEQFIAHARQDVPVLLADVRRLRAELADAEAEKAKLIRWHGEDEKALARMRGVIERLRAEVTATRTRTLATEADEIVAHCPDHGSRDGVWMDCHCAVADDMRRRTAAPASAVAVSGGEQ